MTQPLAARVAARNGTQDEQNDQASPGVPATEVDLAQNDQMLRWLNERKSYFAAALPRHINEGQFIQAALTAIYKTPALQKCKPETLMMALMSCAKFGLDPDGVHAAIVPYGDKAQFVPMYMGYIELMYRSGMVESVIFDHVRDSDRWRYNVASRPPDDFEHEPDLLNRHKGEPILAYAFAWMKGGARSQVIFLNRAEAEEIRDTRSKAYQLAERKRQSEPARFAQNPDWGIYNSTWHTDFDAMWLKSTVRRLAKRVPTSPEIRELLKVDDQLDLLERLSTPVGALPPVDRTAIDAPEDPSGPDGDDGDWPPVAQPGGSTTSDAG
jgi:phage RecT family recombinase